LISTKNCLRVQVGHQQFQDGGLSHDNRRSILGSQDGSTDHQGGVRKGEEVPAKVSEFEIQFKKFRWAVFLYLASSEGGSIGGKSTDGVIICTEVGIHRKTENTPVRRRNHPTIKPQSPSSGEETSSFVGGGKGKGGFCLMGVPFFLEVVSSRWEGVYSYARDPLNKEDSFHFIHCLLNAESPWKGGPASVGNTLAPCQAPLRKNYFLHSPAPGSPCFLSVLPFFSKP